MRISAGISAGVLLTVAGNAWGQQPPTQEHHDRLTKVAKFVVTSPMCERLGVRVDPDLANKVEAAIHDEMASWDVNWLDIVNLKSETLTRETAIFKTDLDTVVENAKTESQLRSLKDVLVSYARICVNASTDPIFSSLITLPDGYNVIQAANNFADEMLEGGGLASWQTPQIIARGDLMTIAGACRSKIGAVRSDALREEFGRSNEYRVRSYYAKSFDEGLADPSLFSTLAGCNKAIAIFRAKAQ